MNAARKLACVVLLAVCAVSLAADWLAPSGYAKQFREVPSSPPSRQHLLGTDEIGRDRFARVLYGTRISLVLAPAAALVSTLLAALVGGLAGYLGGIWLRIATSFTDLFLSLPWLFLLIAVRALLPLNVSPLSSVLITFFILGLLGWAASARVLSASADSLRNSDSRRAGRQDLARWLNGSLLLPPQCVSISVSAGSNSEGRRYESEPGGIAGRIRCVRGSGKRRTKKLTHVAQHFAAASEVRRTGSE